MTEHYRISGATAEGVARSVELGVRSGHLAPGAGLPPVRVLAAELSVSPATVAKAYTELRRRGVVSTAGRGGTRIRQRPSVRPRSQHALTALPGALDLAAGSPAPDLLPDVGPALRRVAARGHDAGGYRQVGMIPALRERAVARLEADGVPVAGTASAPAAVTVTAGALDGVERLLGAHLRPGDRVGVEDPGWAALLDLVTALGLEPVPMAVDDDGPTEAGMRRALERGVAAVVVTARAHNPTGAAVGRERASVLRDLLGRFPGTLLIEDDHAAELSPLPLHPLAGATSSWAFLRSTSKPYGPDLRLAVLAGDEGTVARVEDRMRLGAGWVSSLLQALVVELWDDPQVARAVDRARVEYAARRSALVAALADRGLVAHGRTGINVWVPGVDETRVVAALRDRYAVAPGAVFRLESGQGIRITVSGLLVGEVDALADAVVEAAGGAGRAVTV